jgi:hypothetical protein
VEALFINPRSLTDPSSIIQAKFDFEEHLKSMQIELLTALDYRLFVDEDEYKNTSDVFVELFNQWKIKVSAAAATPHLAIEEEKKGGGIQS